MEKTLIIIRHAHRFKIPSREADNGLSPKGKKQARAAWRFFKKRYPASRPVLISSPKLRCVETLAPISQGKAVRGKPLRIQILDALDEGGDLQVKAASFLSWWRKKGPKICVISSHGDWIPEFLKLTTGAEVELKKGGWAELKLETARAQLTWLLQKL